MLLSRRGLGVMFSTVLCLRAGDLCVNVVDRGGEALEGVIVDVRETGLTRDAIEIHKSTDRRGRVCFGELRDGRYHVRLSLTGFITMAYENVRVDVLRAGGISARMEFGDVIELEIPEAIRISGAILLDGKPLEKGRVCLLSAGGSEVRCITTDRHGQYGLTAQPGNYSLGVFLRGSLLYRSAPREFKAGRFRDVLPRELRQDR